MIFFLSNSRKEVRRILFMCSEVESSGLKAITSLLWQYVLCVCLPGIYFTFCTNIQGWVFCAKASLLPPQAFDSLQNTWGRKILENKVLTQLQTNVPKIWNYRLNQGHTNVMLILSWAMSTQTWRFVPPVSSFLPWSPHKSFSVMEHSHSQCSLKQDWKW